MPGILGDLKQRMRARAEQQTINQFFVLQGERSQLMGKLEDDMGIWRCEQFGSARGQPAVARLALALRTVPVSACNGELSITCLMGSLF